MGCSSPTSLWSYPQPVPEQPAIRDLVCFFTERVDLLLDGVPQPRTVSPWSDGTAEVIDGAASRSIERIEGPWCTSSRRGGA